MRVIGISSGLGVSLYPFRKEKILMNIEPRGVFHTKDNEQWFANFGETPLVKSDERFILVKTRQVNSVDAVIGSPDCGSGSVLRYSRAKKLGDHKKNDSLLLFIGGVAHFRPKFFYFENLDSLFKSFPEADFDAAFKNYRLIKHVASVCMWGNSQITRKRLVIIGVRKDIPKKVDKYFRLPDYRLKNTTCFNLYGDLDFISPRKAFKLGHMREDLDEEISIYGGKKMKIFKIEEYWDIVGKDKRRWEVKDRRYKTAPGVYRNRKNDYPATARKANRQFDHNGLMLTPRQLARIQGIPDHFEIYMERDKLNYWINKGRTVVTKTPPYEISYWFYKKLLKSEHIWQ